MPERAAPPIIAGLAIGVAVIVIFALLYYSSTPRTRYTSLYDAIQPDLSQVAINKATIEVRTVSEFSPVTGPSLCVATLNELNIKSDLAPLATALSEADKTGGELVTHRLSPEDFLPIAKKLCINQAMIARNEDSSVHRYPGRIAIDNGGLKYWYGVSIFWNKTEESRFKPIDENFDGMMPNHDMMKVYVFPSNELYFEEDLLSDIQNEVAFFDLANKNNATFGASPVGIYNLDDYLVVPNGVEFYIDKEFVKPDGSSIDMNDLHPSVGLGNLFSQGSIPVLHDYEYVQIETIWFVVDSKSDQESIDAHIDEIRSVLKSHISQCLEYKRAHPHEAYSPCPNL